MTKTYDFNTYLRRIASENRLAAQAGFLPCRCSGLNYLEELLQNFRGEKAFVAVSDVTDGNTTQRGGGWMKTRVFTIFILHRYRFGDMGDYERAMNLCREVMRQLHSRMIHDAAQYSDDLMQLSLRDIRSRELGGTFLNGCTGLYFMVSMDEPTDLCYNPDEWNL